MREANTMRIGPDDEIWVVTDPRTESELVDVLYETSIRGLELQFRGGLTCAENPTIFTDHDEAEIEAFGRLSAMRAARAIAEAPGNSLQNATRIEIYDENETLVFEADLGAVRPTNDRD